MKANSYDDAKNKAMLESKKFDEQLVYVFRTEKPDGYGFDWGYTLSEAFLDSDDFFAFSGVICESYFNGKEVIENLA